MARGRLLVITLILLLVAVVPTVKWATAGAGSDGGPTGLERFYVQELSWGDCTDFAATPEDKTAFAAPGLQCAYLDLPLDYADPDGRAIKVGLLRRPASDPAGRIGSLVVNPGGPGGSGMSAVASLADRAAGTELGRRFDLVGFDPRGIGASRPQIRCLTPAERDAERRMDLNVDTSPAGVARTENQERTDVTRCVSRTGTELMATIGTRDVTRDLDILRSALGDAQLSYLGYSYGTRIGTSYAEAFPGNVRVMVLDGAIDPRQNRAEQLISQARGFQQAFDTFAAQCAGIAGCALGQDRTQAVATFQRLVRPLITKPVPVSDGRVLSYTDATIGVVQALYLPALWAPLDRGLQELAQGRGDVLMQLADLYYGRSPDGSYSTTTDAFQAVNCIDDPPITDPEVARRVDAQYRAAAPFLDTGMAPSPARDICAFWPIPATGGPHQPQAPGLPPVLVISTTRDPATPYQAGVTLAHDLNGRLLTFDGTQHTVFLQGVACVDDATISYLVTRQPPPEGTRCEATP